MSERVEFGDGCEDCGGTGAQYEHATDCRSRFCFGNGDEHSCVRGRWVPCAGCPNVQVAIEEAAQAREGSGLDCYECGSWLSLEHHSSATGLCRGCWEQQRAELSAIRRGDALPF